MFKKTIELFIENISFACYNLVHDTKYPRQTRNILGNMLRRYWQSIASSGNLSIYKRLMKQVLRKQSHTSFWPLILCKKFISRWKTQLDLMKQIYADKACVKIQLNYNGKRFLPVCFETSLTSLITFSYKFIGVQ